MIITITGKPCSGKGTVSKLFCEKHNFNYMCVGDMMRDLAIKNGQTILEFQQNNPNIKEVDKQLDGFTEEIGKTRLDENLMIDSRLAWHFIPKSFKVFVDVDWETAGGRLMQAERDSESAKDLESAIKTLKGRWQVENDRYQELYGVNNYNLENYNLVINSSNKTVEEIVEIITKAYKEFMQNA